MPRRPAALPECEQCHRPQNDASVLATVYGPRGDDGLPHTKRICGAKGCWDGATEAGYYSSSQLKDRHRP